MNRRKETFLLKRLCYINLMGLILVMGCSTTDSHRMVHITESDYSTMVLASSKRAQSYEGLINTIDLRATLLTSKVRHAQTLRKATNFQWSDIEINSDREYNNKASASETKVFLSFYTPQVKDDNLNKADTVWRVFLDADGRRFVGTVQKMNDTQSEILDMYPDHTKWGTPYMVKFLVPTSVIESVSARLTLTGPVGSTSVTF